MLVPTGLNLASATPCSVSSGSWSRSAVPIASLLTVLPPQALQRGTIVSMPLRPLSMHYMVEMSVFKRGEMGGVPEHRLESAQRIPRAWGLACGSAGRSGTAPTQSGGKEGFRFELCRLETNFHQLFHTAMAFFAPRAAKRLRVSTPINGWVCKDCRRSFASSLQSRQQQQPASSQPLGQDEKTTHFGFETVAENIKASKGQINHFRVVAHC
jgi:uncharacterized protein YlaI